MRKKTVNHVADTIFWYVLYFLPIISYLLFCFTEPTVATKIDNSTDTVSVVATADDNPYVLPAGRYVFNENLNFSPFGSSISETLTFDFLFGDVSYTSLFVLVEEKAIYANAITQLYYNTWKVDSRVMVLEVDAVFNNPNYKTFITSNSVYSAPDIPIEPSLDIIPFYDYMISSYQFTENNFIYTTISNLFGVNGVFNLALDKGIYLYFSWFIGVYLMHLFVDFILFIPRLCHKWLKEFTQGD